VLWPVSDRPESGRSRCSGRWRYSGRSRVSGRVEGVQSLDAIGCVELILNGREKTDQFFNTSVVFAFCMITLHSKNLDLTNGFELRRSILHRLQEAG
jgi:hypothetical protein